MMTKRLIYGMIRRNVREEEISEVSGKILQWDPSQEDPVSASEIEKAFTSLRAVLIENPEISCKIGIQDPRGVSNVMLTSALLRGGAIEPRVRDDILARMSVKLEVPTQAVLSA